MTNELVKRNDYASFLEDENKTVEEETRKEYEAKLALMETTYRQSSKFYAWRTFV